MLAVLGLGVLITLVVLYFAVQSVNENWRRSFACTPPLYEVREVSGHVVKADSQQPIENASILIHEANRFTEGCTTVDHETQLKTDANGFFTTHPQKIGFTGFNVQITITAPGCETYSQALLFSQQWEDSMRTPSFPATFELQCTT